MIVQNDAERGGIVVHHREKQFENAALDPPTPHPVVRDRVRAIVRLAAKLDFGVVIRTIGLVIEICFILPLSDQSLETRILHHKIFDIGFMLIVFAL
jgi:quinol-cytochrome oxidoreductase complex cytochrome b subunit